MRRALVPALVLLALAAAPAGAHYFPGERLVLVQAEPAAAAILVTYRPPTGLFPGALETDARWSGLGGALIKAVLAARALTVIDARLDGARLRPDDVQVKLTQDAPGRRVVAVLISVPVPHGAHRLELKVAASGEATSTEWLDHARGRVARFGPRPTGTPFVGPGTLVLEWR